MAEGKSISKSEIIKWALTLGCALLLILIPETGWYTAQIKTFFIVTAVSLFIIAFELIPTVVMAVLLPVLYIIFGVAPATDVMSPWLGEMMLMLLGAFFLAAILEQSGLLTRVAYFLMSKVNGSYTKLLLGIFFVGILLTLLTFGTGYLVLAPLCAGLCGALAVNKTKMGAGIAMACMLGTCTSKAFTYPIADYGFMISSAGGLADSVLPDLTFFNVIFHNSPMFIICLITILIVAKWYKPDKDLDGSEYFKEKLDSLGEVTRVEKMTAILLAIIVTYTVACSFTGWDMYWGFMLVPWLAFLPGIKAADEKTLKIMNWDMIFFTAGCMSIGATASTLGFGDILVGMMSSMFAGGNVFVVFGCVFLVIFFMNFLMTPMAIWALLSGPMMIVATNLNMNPLPFFYCLMGCAEAIVLPYEYIPYLVIYSFGMMQMGDFIKLSVVRCAIYVIGFLFVLLPFWMFLGIV